MPYKKYSCSSKRMEQYVEKYFLSISGKIPVMIDGEPLEDRDGNAVMIDSYITPPTLTGLANYLGINRRTLLNWAKDEKCRYHDCVEMAKQRIEQYLEERLTTARHTDGVKFSLVNNFRESWTDKKELEIGPETRRSEALTAVSLADKLAMIITASDKARATMGYSENEESEDDQS